MSLSRRKFLTLSLGGGVAVAGGLIAASHPLWDTNQVLTEHSRRSWALGSDVTMTVLGTDATHANRVLDAAFAELETVERVMSLYRPDSQISVLNRERVLHQPHPYLVEVLTASAETSRLSNGAFDITVQPLWDAFAIAQKQGRLPSDDEVGKARQAVDWRAVEVTKERVRLLSPVQAVTLNGVAQGFAADRAVAALRAHGIEHALVNAGEIGSLGTKPSGDPWKVGVQHPRQREAFAALAALSSRCLSTSGDYETTFSADFSKNHIFDPRTGQSPSELASVSIAAPTAMQADLLSTTAMVLGPERSLELIAQLQDVDALLILKNGRTLQTSGFAGNA